MSTEPKTFNLPALTDFYERNTGLTAENGTIHLGVRHTDTETGQTFQRVWACTPEAGWDNLDIPVEKFEAILEH